MINTKKVAFNLSGSMITTVVDNAMVPIRKYFVPTQMVFAVTNPRSVCLKPAINHMIQAHKPSIPRARIAAILAMLNHEDMVTFLSSKHES